MTVETANQRREDIPAKAVLRRARAILQAYDAASSSLGVSELARRSGLPKATVHRLVQELVTCDLLERDGHRYRLGPWLYELGQRAPAHRLLRVAAAPYLDDLSRITQEMALLVVPGRDGMLFTEKYVGSRGRGHIATQFDGRAPMYCAASGKVILAFGPPERVDELCAAGLDGWGCYPGTNPRRLRAELREVRRQGYATTRLNIGIEYLAIAGPVWSADSVVAGLSVVAPTGRLDVNRCSPVLLMACAGLSRALRGGR